MSNYSLKRVFWPPSMVMKQLGSVLYFKHLIKWNKFNSWFFKHSFSSLPVSAGAIGMGCIGFPAHPVWEVTGACNLRCIHCHATSGKAEPDELTTDEGKRFIDGLVKCDEFRMLVYTGGEPLVRSDLFELMNHSKNVGLTNVIATNGTLITEEVAYKLKEAGVVGVAVSLDSSESHIHNKIRKSDTAFELALRGMRNVKKAGMLLQINATAMEYNLDSLDELLELTDSEGSGIMLMYQLVPVGRGNKIEEAALKINQNERLLKLLAEKQKNISTLIEPVAGPQYWPYLIEKKFYSNNGVNTSIKGVQREGFKKKLAEKVFHGCAAARGFVYIKANGDIWPCPFVEVSGGNLREQSFEKIYRESEVFVKLRNRENNLKGKCGECTYRKMCGGCRGRAMAYTGDYLSEDPSCFINT
jgi:AdoMet-dependent heme synthase